MADQLLDRVLPSLVPAAVAGLVSVAGGWWIQKKAQRFQEKNLDKALIVERHAQAYQRWRQIYFFDRKVEGDGWAKFMNEMLDWSAANKLYLTEVAWKTFTEAVHARVLMDSLGDSPISATDRAKAFARLEKAGDAILAASPRYTS